MALSVYQPGSSIVQSQQLELMRKQQEFDQAQALRKQSTAGDIFDILKQGIAMASDLSGVAVNMAKIDEAKANMAGVQAQTQLKQQEAETQARLGRGEFASLQELQAKGGRVGGEALPGEQKLSGVIGGQKQDYYMLDKERANIQLEQSKIKQQQESEQRRIQEKMLDDRSKEAALLSNSESDLRKEYNNNKVIKDFPDVKKNYENILKNANKPGSGASDTALATLVVKMLDPGVQVTKSEIENLTQTGGLVDRAVSYLSRLQGGGILSPEQRRELVSIATDAYSGSLGAKQEIDNFYGSVAQRKGFNLLNVLGKEAINSLEIANPEERNLAVNLEDGDAKLRNQFMTKEQGQVNLPLVGNAQAAPSEGFNPQLFIQKRGSMKEKKPAPKKTGAGILGGR